MAGFLLLAKAASGGAYVGPGDINGAALFWGGLRGFSAAYSTGANPAIDVVDQAGANPTTINITSAGDLDIAALTAWVAAHSVTTICVAKVYDQSGSGNHVVQATLANMPTLVTSVSGITSSRYVLKYNGTTQFLRAGSAFGTVVVPWSMSAVANRLSGTNFQGVIACNTGARGIIYGNAASAVGLFNGAALNPSVTETDAAFHALQGHALASTVNNVYMDGANNVGTSGNTMALTGLTLNYGATGISSNMLAGYMGEAGLWTSDTTSNDATANSNQRTYWGF